MKRITDTLMVSLSGQYKEKKGRRRYGIRKDYDNYLPLVLQASAYARGGPAKAYSVNKVGIKWTGLNRRLSRAYGHARIYGVATESAKDS